MTYETPELLKKNLSRIISDMDDCSELFIKQPGIDFSRNRKLSFSQTIEFFLSMNGNSIRKEWLDFWNYNPSTASISVFFQQRVKILSETMDF